jgi:hypothetical protein
MPSLFNFFSKKKKEQEAQKPGLRIAHSTYPTFPEGMSETEKFNATWQAIAKSSEEVYEKMQKPSFK